MQIKVLLQYLKGDERYGAYSVTDRAVVCIWLYFTACHHLGLSGRIIYNNEPERVWIDRDAVL